MGPRIPTEQEIEIRLSVHYTSFWAPYTGRFEIFDVAFTPASDRRYRMELECERDYIDVRTLQLLADGGINPVPFRLEECRAGLFTIRSATLWIGARLLRSR